MERRQRHSAYRRLGLVFKPHVAPLWIWLAYIFCSVLVYAILVLLSPSDPSLAFQDWAALHPDWLIIGVVVGVALPLGLVVLLVWTAIQARRIRRQESTLANNARLLLRQTKRDA